MKSPVRSAVSWVDGANDILDYEKSIPAMFVSNVLNFATDDKNHRKYKVICRRQQYEAANMIVNRIICWQPKTQITGTFNAADIPNMAALATKEELLRFFRHDSRKVAITTIFRFDDADGVLNERGNIIVMADEAHRTQEGGLGVKMRTALPNAFFSG